MIVMLPIDKFDRRRDAEHLENNHRVHGPV